MAAFLRFKDLWIPWIHWLTLALLFLMAIGMTEACSGQGRTAASASSASGVGPKQLLQRQARLLSRSQQDPLAIRVRARYPESSMPSHVLNEPRQRELLIRDIIRLPGSKCRLVTVRRRSHMLRPSWGSTGVGGGGSVLLDIWGLRPDGNLQKLGAGPEVGADYWLYDDLDPHIVSAFANACYSVGQREGKERLVIGLSLLSGGSIWDEDATTRPLMVNVKSKADFPRDLPSQVQDCLDRNVGRLKQCVGLNTDHTGKHEATRTRCFLYTSTRPLWSWTDMACFGFLYGGDGELLFAEILLHDKCSDTGSRTFMREIGH